MTSQPRSTSSCASEPPKMPAPTTIALDTGRRLVDDERALVDVAAQPHFLLRPERAGLGIAGELELLLALLREVGDGKRRVRAGGRGRLVEHCAHPAEGGGWPAREESA